MDPKTYQLLELGDTWAVARESTTGSPFWVVERYDWSDPSVVRWTSGGATRARDKVLLGLLHRSPMHLAIARMWRKTLDEYARV